MTPTFNAYSIINKLVSLEQEKRRIGRIPAVIRKLTPLNKKYESLCDSISYYYDILHGFYPELSDTYDINKFVSLRRDGFIRNKIRSAVVGSEIITCTY